MNPDQERPFWLSGHFDSMGSRPSHLDAAEPVFYPRTESPLISVISPSFRHRAYLPSTLTTIASQSFRNFEHIVVDGGSTDGTVEFLQSCENLRWISEPDEGYVDAFHRGLALARGQWIMQCCISDGLLVDDWFQRCVDLITSSPDVALVWGLPRSLGVDGTLGTLAYNDLFVDGNVRGFRRDFLDWLSRGFVLPEGNLLVRRDVLDACFPTRLECEVRGVDPWLEFNSRFREMGFMTAGLPVVANYGRAHEDSNTASEFADGSWMKMRRHYNRQVALARRRYLALGHPKAFVTPDGHIATRVSFSFRERSEGLAWAGTDSAARQLRPLLNRLDEPARERIRTARRQLFRHANTGEQ